MFFGEGQGDWWISESDIRHGPSHIFNLTVWPGEFIAIVGESGSGKSTLMNIIGVLDKPTSGEYTLDGVDIHKADDDELAGIESIVLCAIGGVIGVGLGIGLGSVLSQVMGYSARPSVAAIIIAVAFSMAIGVFFGYGSLRCGGDFLRDLSGLPGGQGRSHRRPAVRIRVPFVICLSAQN